MKKWITDVSDRNQQLNYFWNFPINQKSPVINTRLQSESSRTQRENKEDFSFTTALSLLLPEVKIFSEVASFP